MMDPKICTIIDSASIDNHEPAATKSLLLLFSNFPLPWKTCSTPTSIFFSYESDHMKRYILLEGTIEFAPFRILRLLLKYRRNGISSLEVAVLYRKDQYHDNYVFLKSIKWWQRRRIGAACFDFYFWKGQSAGSFRLVIIKSISCKSMVFGIVSGTVKCKYSGVDFHSIISGFLNNCNGNGDGLCIRWLFLFLWTLLSPLLIVDSCLDIARMYVLEK